MSTKYKFLDHEAIYFVSFATVSWVDVFTRPTYNDIFIDSMRYCQQNKGLNLHAWCLMSNHAHLVFSRSGVLDVEILERPMSLEGYVFGY